MQKKSPLNSASVSPRALVVLLVCAAACLLVTRTLPAFFRSETPANLSQRTLSFAERVAYQRAVEDVYWRHRIWPKERPDAKPSLEAVMSQAQLERKVADYLHKSQALEDYWQRLITAEQLQAEMNRMAKHTRQPDVLRELFEAVGDDPFVIAECLARPALAERLLTNWYAYDQRIHGDLKQHAKAELLAHPSVEQMKQLSGNYSEIEFIRSESGHEKNRQMVGHGVQLNSRDWEQAVQKLAATFGDRPVAAGVLPVKVATPTRVKTGVLSALQEDSDCYYSTAMIDASKERMKLATVAWRKEDVGSWIARVQRQVPTALAAPNGDYILPIIITGGCIDDTWTATPAPPDGREWHTAVWTGTEMIIWGGEIYPVTVNGTGGRYNPSTDTWTSTSMTNAPSSRALHTAVWTGDEMVVWGGQNDTGHLNTGGRYNPTTDSWTTTSTANAPEPRDSHTAVWTGSEMVVWGGLGDSGYLSTGGMYDPITDSWMPISTTNAPAERYHHTAVWTGDVMIVWGGFDGLSDLKTGGRYNPGTNSWAATSTTNAPDRRENHSAVGTGSEMIVWGGVVDLNTGGRYTPNTDAGTPPTTTHSPDGRDLHTAVWTGSEMIV